ncbi:MAG TPA: hypothetical protein VFD40_01440 [Candidatus Paceibacterota bacterium]|nr:hypothetical protein [Candidatus Paceibacterota bacterium]
MNQKYKKLIIILAVILLAALVLILILSNKKNKVDLTYGGWETSIYTGFLKPQKGAWSELVIIDEEGNKSLQRSIYLGEKTIEGVRAYGVETDPNVFDSGGSVIQVWYEYSTDEIIKIANGAKKGKEVTCINALLLETLFPTLKAYLPTIVTPDKYSSMNEYTYGTFTTETNKTIQVAKFIDAYETEIWLSSEVPFGVIKGVFMPTNKTVVYLRNFDFSGAVPIISGTQMTNCATQKLFDSSQ